MKGRDGEPLFIEGIGDNAVGCFISVHYYDDQPREDWARIFGPYLDTHSALEALTRIEVEPYAWIAITYMSMAAAEDEASDGVHGVEYA